MVTSPRSVLSISNMATSNIRTLFVSKLPWTVCRDTLREHFQQYGRLVSAKVLFDKPSGRQRGCGFVVFETAEEANNALVAENHVIDGSKVDVMLNRTMTKRESTDM